MHTDRLTAAPYLPLDHVARSLARFITALLVLSGAVVLFEPGPYEVLLPMALLFWVLAGLKVNWRFPLYLGLCVFIFLGGVFAVTLLPAWGDGLLYMTITLFLSGSGFFYASIVLTDTEWAVRTINRFYVVGAVVTGLAGTLGYFGLGPTEMFTLFGRAKGFFQDPNVYSAFLVYPIVYLFTRIIREENRISFWHLFALSFIGFSLLVSFSRGAIGHLVFSGAIAAYLAFVTSAHLKRRVRIAALCGALGLAAVVGVVGALSVPQVAQMVDERFSATQSYDVGYEGRFGRHARGFALALEKPFGIGLGNFGKTFTEDPHNVFLKMLMDYGWLGFFAFTTIVVCTLYMGLKVVLRAHPHKDTAIAAYATFIGVVGLGLIIDTNHWRHFWLLTGLIWGLHAATIRPGAVQSRCAQANSARPH